VTSSWFLIPLQKFWSSSVFTYLNWKDRQFAYKRNIEARSCNHCCSGKSVKYYTFWVTIWSLRYPACNAHAPYCHLWPVWLYLNFPHYLTNRTIFWRKNRVIQYKILPEIFLITRRIQWDTTVNVHRSLCKVLVIVVRF